MVTYRSIYDRPNFFELPRISHDHIRHLCAVVSEISGRPEVKSPVPSIRPVRQGPLPPDQFDRYRRYFSSAYQADLAALAAMPPNSGRNKQAFRFVCRFGRLVHHGLMPADRMIGDVIAACTANGLAAEDGMRAIHATIISGLRMAAQDALPDLGARHG
jgi:hypothetical protein